MPSGRRLSAACDLNYDGLARLLDFWAARRRFAMRIKLVVVEGKVNKPEVELDLPATIGRSREASITIGHGTVSRKHCDLLAAEGRLLIRDNSSLNGVFVGQTRVQEAVVLPGETITVGPLTFRVEYELPSDESPEADEETAGRTVRNFSTSTQPVAAVPPSAGETIDWQPQQSDTSGDLFPAVEPPGAPEPALPPMPAALAGPKPGVPIAIPVAVATPAALTPPVGPPQAPAAASADLPGMPKADEPNVREAEPELQEFFKQLGM